MQARATADLDAIEITVLDEADHMADLGFLPGRAPAARPDPARAASGCCSRPPSTPAIDVLVKRFLHRPGHPQVDSAQSPVSDDDPPRAARRPRAPAAGAGRPDQRARPHRWSSPAPSTAPRRWPASSTAAACPPSSCTATSARTPAPATWTPSPPARPRTLVATDIAARGIHVDDVALVIHADPPVEHKAYLHRSGRTARAGAEGTVVTLMTDDQVARRPRPHPEGRHHADHHHARRRRPPAARRARPRRAGHSCPAASSSRRPRPPTAPSLRRRLAAAAAAPSSAARPAAAAAPRPQGAARPAGAGAPRRPGSSGRGAAVGRHRAAGRVAAASVAGGQSRHSAASFSSGRR